MTADADSSGEGDTLSDEDRARTDPVECHVNPESEDKELHNALGGKGGEGAQEGALPPKAGPGEFDLLKVIGMGAFGKVLQVRLGMIPHPPSLPPSPSRSESATTHMHTYSNKLSYAATVYGCCSERLMLTSQNRIYEKRTSAVRLDVWMLPFVAYSCEYTPFNRAGGTALRSPLVVLYYTNQMETNVQSVVSL